MTRRNTGPGRIDDHTNISFVIARLYNFDTDWHELKPEHTSWLDRVAIPRLADASGIYVLGLASRAGLEEHNLQLSEQRKQAVLDYLSGSVRDSTQTFQDWAGESHAYGHQNDDQYDRAAILAI